MSIKFANERGSYEECFSWNDLNKRKVSFAQKIVLFNAQYGNCNLIHFWFAKFMKTARVKKILEKLSRTRFLTELEFRALFFGATQQGKKCAKFKSRKKSCS